MSRAVLVSLLVLAAAVAPAIPVLDARSAKPCQPGVVFESEDVRVWFHGHKDFFKVFDTAGEEDEGGHYSYATTAIVERDADGEEVARMNLHQAFPHTSVCEVVDDEGFVNMTLVVTDRLTGRDGTATVGFTFHFNKTSHGAKFDLDVRDWPWSEGANHTLGFAFRLEAGSWNVEAAENGVGFRDGNGTARGYVEWAANATATYADGHREEALVASEIASGGHSADVELTYGNVTSGYSRLLHDPWMGSGDYLILAGRVLVGLAPIEDLAPGVTGALRRLL